MTKIEKLMCDALCSLSVHEDKYINAKITTNGLTFMQIFMA